MRLGRGVDQRRKFHVRNLLALGSGGFDVLYVNVTRGLELPSDRGAHVMKLPYSPGQAAASHAEERGALYLRAVEERNHQPVLSEIALPEGWMAGCVFEIS